jgi:hypothetical protein
MMVGIGAIFYFSFVLIRATFYNLASD